MVKLRLYLSFCLFLVLFVPKGVAQDIHFSQQILSGLQINPALSTNFEGSWQAGSVYRQQWRSVGVPFTTSSLFFTKKFYTPIPALKAFASLGVTTDKSGDAVLNATLFDFRLGAEYQYYDHFFSLGIQNGYVSKSFNQNGLTFPGQYDRSIGGFNENLASGENFAGNSTSYYDLNVGVMYKTQLRYAWKLTAGLSANHITEPNETFFNDDNVKKRGFGVQTRLDKKLNEKYDIQPQLNYYRANKAREIVIGTGFFMKQLSFGPVDNVTPFLLMRTGVARNSDAFIVGSRAELGAFDFGISYDVNISDLELASNYKGAFEISLIYTAPKIEPTQRRIPCERY